MSGLENPSDARTKYLGPESLLRHTSALRRVPVDGWMNPVFLQSCHRLKKISDMENAYFADGDTV